MKPFTIIVIAFNRLEYTKRTIASLAQTVPKDTRLIFFNNASTEQGFKEYVFGELRELFPNLLYTHRLQNAGWGKAVNEALLNVHTDHVLISNNDVLYRQGWAEKCFELLEVHPTLGVLGVWKHTAHGVLEERGDLVVKDQMPAVGWFFHKDTIATIGAFPEKGPCATKGGNGEDVEYCIRAAQKGLLVGGPKEDVAIHIDGY